MTIAIAAVLMIAFAVAWASTALLINLLRRRKLLDHPNARSCHRVPTPRGGGLGLLAGFGAGLAFSMYATGASFPWYLIVAAILVACCGLFDDLLHLPAWLRFLAHSVAASIVVWGGGPLASIPLPPPLDFPLGAAAIPVSLIWIVGVVNIYNFLDGIDGFAGLQTLIAGLAVASMNLNAGSQAFGLALAAAAAGFLIHNWHPARIFMGDVGSTTIGFLLASCPFVLERAVRPTAVFAVALCTWFFLADGTFTLFCRLLRRERIWEAHRSHLYQQLVLTGAPHDLIAGRVGLMMAVVSAAAVAAVRMSISVLHWLSLALAVSLFLAYLLLVMRLRTASAALPLDSASAADHPLRNLPNHSLR